MLDSKSYLPRSFRTTPRKSPRLCAKPQLAVRVVGSSAARIVGHLRSRIHGFGRYWYSFRSSCCGLHLCPSSEDLAVRVHGCRWIGSRKSDSLRHRPSRRRTFAAEAHRSPTLRASARPLREPGVLCHDGPLDAAPTDSLQVVCALRRRVRNAPSSVHAGDLQWTRYPFPSLGITDNASTEDRQHEQMRAIFSG